jgi:hypothetical protein
LPDASGVAAGAVHLQALLLPQAASSRPLQGEGLAACLTLGLAAGVAAGLAGAGAVSVGGLSAGASAAGVGSAWAVAGDFFLTLGSTVVAGSGAAAGGVAADP